MAKTINPFKDKPVEGSLCRVISWQHLSKSSVFQLKTWVNTASLNVNEVLFDVFELPDADGFGIRLYDIPWSRTNLAFKQGISLNQLVSAHIKNSVPEELTDILKKAGEADTRIILFEANAPVLSGLTVY